MHGIMKFRVATSKFNMGFYKAGVKKSHQHNLINCDPIGLVKAILI